MGVLDDRSADMYVLRLLAAIQSSCTIHATYKACSPAREGLKGKGCPVISARASSPDIARGVLNKMLLVKALFCGIHYPYSDTAS